VNPNPLGCVQAHTSITAARPSASNSCPIGYRASSLDGSPQCTFECRERLGNVRRGDALPSSDPHSRRRVRPRRETVHDTSRRAPPGPPLNHAASGARLLRQAAPCGALGPGRRAGH
jgi:hypothetical protein